MKPEVVLTLRYREEKEANQMKSSQYQKTVLDKQFHTLANMNFNYTKPTEDQFKNKYFDIINDKPKID